MSLRFSHVLFVFALSLVSACSSSDGTPAQIGIPTITAPGSDNGGDTETPPAQNPPQNNGEGNTDIVLGGTSWTIDCHLVKDSDLDGPGVGNSYQRLTVNFTPQTSEYIVDVYYDSDSSCSATRRAQFSAKYAYTVGASLITEDGITAYIFDESLLEESHPNTWDKRIYDLIYLQNGLLYRGLETETSGQRPTRIDFDIYLTRLN